MLCDKDIKVNYNAIIFCHCQNIDFYRFILYFLILLNLRLNIKNTRLLRIFCLISDVSHLFLLRLYSKKIFLSFFNIKLIIWCIILTGKKYD